MRAPSPALSCPAAAPPPGRPCTAPLTTRELARSCGATLCSCLLPCPPLRAAVFLSAILVSCTLLAALLWVALAVQTRRVNRARVRAAEGGWPRLGLLLCASHLLNRNGACGTALSPTACGPDGAAQRLPRTLALTLACLPHRPPACSPLAEAASKRAKLMVPVIVVQPDASFDVATQLFRSNSGNMR